MHRIVLVLPKQSWRQDLGADTLFGKWSQAAGVRQRKDKSQTKDASKGSHCDGPWGSLPPGPYEEHVEPPTPRRTVHEGWGGSEAFILWPWTLISWRLPGALISAGCCTNFFGARESKEPGAWMGPVGYQGCPCPFRGAGRWWRGHGWGVAAPALPGLSPSTSWHLGAQEVMRVAREGTGQVWPGWWLLFFLPSREKSEWTTGGPCKGMTPQARV